MDYGKPVPGKTWKPYKPPVSPMAEGLYITPFGGVWGNNIVKQSETRCYGWVSLFPNTTRSFLADTSDENHVKLYLVTKVDICGDPHDMFFADIKFVKDIGSVEQWNAMPKRKRILLLKYLAFRHGRFMKLLVSAAIASLLTSIMWFIH